MYQNACNRVSLSVKGVQREGGNVKSENGVSWRYLEPERREPDQMPQNNSTDSLTALADNHHRDM